MTISPTDLALACVLSAALASVVTVIWFDRPQKRPTPKPIGAQWTREAAETLVREWSK